MLVFSPAIDMANHGSGSAANCRVRLDIGSERLVLEPLRPVQADEVPMRLSFFTYC